MVKRLEYKASHVSAYVNLHSPPGPLSLLSSSSNHVNLNHSTTILQYNTFTMLPPRLLSTSVLALTAHAFLVPLEVADKAVAAKVNDLNTLTNPTSQSIKLDCSTCPYAIASTRNGHHEWTSDVKSDLIMDFTVEKNQVHLNGVPLLQPQMSTFQPLKIKQVAKEGEIEAHDKKWEAFNGDLGMSYSVAFSQENSVKSMEVQVLGLDGEMIDTDAVSIKCFTKPDGEVSFQSNLIPVFVCQGPY